MGGAVGDASERGIPLKIGVTSTVFQIRIKNKASRYC